MLHQQSAMQNSFSVSDEIQKLKELQNQGILTEEEFEVEPDEVLAVVVIDD